MLLSTQMHKWVALNLMMGGNPAMDWHLIHAKGTNGYAQMAVWTTWPDVDFTKYFTIHLSLLVLLRLLG